MERQWAIRVREAMEGCQRHTFKDAVLWHLTTAPTRESALMSVRLMLEQLKAVERGPDAEVGAPAMTWTYEDHRAAQAEDSRQDMIPAAP